MVGRGSSWAVSAGNSPIWRPNDLLPRVSYANQFTREGSVNKRIRSSRRWRTRVAASGLRTRFVPKFAWLRAPSSTPE